MNNVTPGAWIAITRAVAAMARRFALVWFFRAVVPIFISGGTYVLSYMKQYEPTEFHIGKCWCMGIVLTYGRIAGVMGARGKERRSIALRRSRVPDVVRGEGTAR